MPPPMGTTAPVPAPQPAPAPSPLPAPGAPAPGGSAVTSPVPSSPAPPPGSPDRGWTEAPVFSIVRVQIRDMRAFGDYLVGHLPTIGAFGGRFLAAGAMPQPVEGDWPLRRMIVHQWPLAQAFFQWYESSPYVPWRQIRQRAADTDMVLLQGVAPAGPSSASSALPHSGPAATQRPAFAIADVAVHDDAAFARYAQGQAAPLRAAGGVLLAASGHFEVIEGTWQPRRLLLQRWPSLAAYRTWYDSPAYRPWRDLRWKAAQADIALFEGLSEAEKGERSMP
ncbi:MAG: DUF1330 domain-containing protein [Rubrivivax sp.]|nr:DUF1330 domain-containing protein [Rubrivivax sp.]